MSPSISRTHTEGDSAEPIQSNLHNLQERLEDVRDLLDKRKRSLNHATLRKQFTDELKRVRDVIGGVEHWLAEDGLAVADDIQGITQQLDQCKVGIIHVMAKAGKKKEQKYYFYFL